MIEEALSIEVDDPSSPNTPRDYLIKTFENEDVPYMPMQVNATYKEIWTNSNANVIWLLSKNLEE